MAKSRRGRVQRLTAPTSLSLWWRKPFVIVVAVVAVAENFGLIRDIFDERVPDAVVPAAVLGAWLVCQARLVRPRYLLIPGAVVLIGASIMIASLGDGIGEQLNRAGLTGPILDYPEVLPVRFAERSAELSVRYPSDGPTDAALALMPFIRYVDRCTTEQHRLFLAGMIPEVAYFARRPFAGGAYEHDNFRSPFNQQRVVDRLRRQSVPFALIPDEFAVDLEHGLPIVAAHLRDRYVLLADVNYDDNGEAHSVRILIDKTMPSVSRDAETGWPCFK